MVLPNEIENPGKEEMEDGGFVDPRHLPGQEGGRTKKMG